MRSCAAKHRWLTGHHTQEHHLLQRIRPWPCAHRRTYRMRSCMFELCVEVCKVMCGTTWHNDSRIVSLATNLASFHLLPGAFTTERIQNSLRFLRQGRKQVCGASSYGIRCHSLLNSRCLAWSIALEPINMIVLLPHHHWPRPHNLALSQQYYS